MSKDEGFLEGLILGGVIGAAIGILFAPQPGDKSREELKAGLEELGLADIIERIGEAFEVGKEEAIQAIEEAEM